MCIRDRNLKFGIAPEYSLRSSCSSENPLKVRSITDVKLFIELYAENMCVESRSNSYNVNIPIHWWNCNLRRWLEDWLSSFYIYFMLLYLLKYIMDHSKILSGIPTIENKWGNSFSLPASLKFSRKYRFIVVLLWSCIVILSYFQV